MIRLLTVVVCVFATWGAVSAADDSLAALVGADAALFVEISELDRHVTELSQSEIARRWKSSDLASQFWKWRIDPILKWQALETHVSAVTGAPFSASLRALFGESVALALYLPGEGEPQGVLLARANSSAAVERALQMWDRLEPPLRNEPRTVGRGRYVRRVFRREGSERSLFFAREDRLFVLSDHEQLVRDCVERWAEGDRAKETLTSLPEFRDAASRSEKKAWVKAWLNPRRWDRVLARDAEKSPPQRRLFAAWQTFRAVSAMVDTDGGVHLELTILLDEGRTSSAWRDFAAESPLPSILQSAPSEAIAVLGARVKWPWLMSEWEQLMSDPDREGFERGRRILKGLLLDQDAITHVLPNALSDVGAFAAPRQKRGPWWNRWNLIGIGFLSESISESLRDGIDNALTFAMNAIAADQNGKSDSATWHVKKSQTERVLVGPTGFEPGFAWQTNRLVAANHSELLESRMVGENRRLLTTHAEQFPAARIFAWLDLESLRHAAGVADANLPAAAGIRNLSELADDSFLAIGWTESELKVRAGLNTAK